MEKLTSLGKNGTIWVHIALQENHNYAKEACSDHKIFINLLKISYWLPLLIVCLDFFTRDFMNHIAVSHLSLHSIRWNNYRNCVLHRPQVHQDGKITYVSGSSISIRCWVIRHYIAKWWGHWCDWSRNNLNSLSRYNLYFALQNMDLSSQNLPVISPSNSDISSGQNVLSRWTIWMLLYQTGVILRLLLSNDYE